MPSCDALATRTADEEHLGVEQRRNAAQRVEPLGGVGRRAPWIRRACRRNDVGSVTTADAPQRPTSGFQMCAPDRDRAAAPATAIRSRCRATAEAVATELHELLQAPHIAGPYVLVAHCLGGAYAHPFALLYRLEVAGLRRWRPAKPVLPAPPTHQETPARPRDEIRTPILISSQWQFPEPVSVNFPFPLWASGRNCHW